MGGGGPTKGGNHPNPSLSLSSLVFLALWNCENDLESPAFFDEYRAKEDKITIAPRSDIAHQPPHKRKIGESSTCFFFRTTTGADFFPSSFRATKLTGEEAILKCPGETKKGELKEERTGGSAGGGEKAMAPSSSVYIRRRLSVDRQKRQTFLRKIYTGESMTVMSFLAALFFLAPAASSRFIHARSFVFGSTALTLT